MFTDKDLAARCQQSAWPVLQVDHLGDWNTAEFACQQRPDLIVVLGQPSLSGELLAVPTLGLVRIKPYGGPDSAIALAQEEIEVKVEYFARGSGWPCTLAAVSIARQAYDGLLGITLKTDLIAEDLLLETAKSLENGSPAHASKEVNEWIQRILSPSLDQFTPRPVPSSAPRTKGHQRCRSLAKLFVHSLLGLPWITGRNWYRRLRGRYPVLVLTHHLVSDRPHRMGVPTEDFWRQVRFLQRHYRIVSLSEAIGLLRSGRVTAPTVALTLDDGYGDNFITLRAVAEETGTPVAMFVATQPIEAHQEFDHDLAAGTRGFFPLTWDQVREWSRRGVEFGSHTRTHFDCGSHDRARLETEIARSRRDLEIRLGQRCNFFGFPFGKAENISPEATRIAASTYQSFFSSYGGENLPGEGRIQQHLLRKGFYSDPWELELEMQSVFVLAEGSKARFKRALERLRVKILNAQPERRWHGGSSTQA
jgi:peptidoglycan/xylan/chitin deacetylase (PgdA/CDA1 family)